MPSAEILAWMDGENLPRPANLDQAALGFSRWAEIKSRTEDPDLRSFIAKTATHAQARRLLEGLFGNSQFLTSALLAEPAFFRLIAEEGPDPAMAQIFAVIAHGTLWPDERASRMKALRVARRRTALAVAIADLTGAWSLQQVTGALSGFAEAALCSASDFLLAEAAAKGKITLADPSAPGEDSGLILLGMGKLGAGELNYSSDIDLIALFDAERATLAEPDEAQDFYIRLIRALIEMIEHRTQDGFVFRTDLRLRPDPGATPVAIPVLAAEIYYESAGQNWERAAMIKARPVAGDIAAGTAFLGTLRPFLWRRHLDFAAIDDIHSIKRQIHAHRGGSAIALHGHNIKLGRGGIREIEFFAQTQQLIWGGRERDLRMRDTCGALRGLADAGHVAADTAAALIESYTFLRTLEHRLQMVADQQTHAMPKDDAGIDAIAAFMGYDSAAPFTEALIGHLHQVEAHYAELFEEAPDLGETGNLVFTGAEDDPDTLGTLRQIGYRNPEAVAAVIRAWHHGRYRATRSARARELLTEIAPALLRALANTADPDAAMIRMSDFVAALPAGVQLFSLLHANPGLLNLIAEIMGSAPRLGAVLARQPALIEGVIAADPEPESESGAEMNSDLAERIKDSGSFEETLDLTRRWTGEHIFRLGVRILQGGTDPVAAGRAFSDLAEAALGVLHPAVEAEFAARHGRIDGGGMAVVALGKLGSREMTVESDLDLIFVHDSPDGISSDGEKPLDPSVYFMRLAQRFLNAITAPTAEGTLYEVDMRLRPSGNAGPLTTTLEAFARYQAASAWSWEHMALTRARVIAGPAQLAEKLHAAIQETLTRPRDPAKLVRDVAEMRGRIAAEHGSDTPWDAKHPWNTKHMRGGLVDIEFIAQYLQLLHAHDHPDILAPNTADALGRLAQAGLLATDAAETLIQALRLWQRLQGILRLTVGEGQLDRELPPGPAAMVARCTGAVDIAELKEMMGAASAQAQRYFQDLIEAPADAARAAAEAAGDGKETE